MIGFTLLLSLLSAVLVLAQGPLPILTLPWGSWQATKYTQEGDFYTFQNIRFGKSPTDALRFNKPQFPDAIADPSKLMDNTYGPTCPQVDPNPPTCPNKNGREPIIPRTPRDSIIAEDCLFLDIYVPKSAWDNKQLAKTPVVVWIFGGAFVFGSKNTDFTPFYNATGLLQTGSKTPPAGNFIFVTGNYRVGALGWLAGITMEAQALPNAGLYDQRLVFEWVQKYISLVGGDNKQVSAWGESAGASSIMHHLVSKNGAQDPLFTSALLQSPAYQLRWDRTGTLESIFYNFTNIAGCAGSYPKDAISCLQKLDTSTIVKATQKIVADIFSITGGLPFGPSVDGNLIQTLAPVSLYTGKFWKLSNIAVSHVTSEASTWRPCWVKTPQDFTRFVSLLVPQPNLGQLRADIEAKYPSSAYKNQQDRVEAVIQDGAFTCNTRFLYDSYHTVAKTYMMQYDLGNISPTQNYAVHASDLFPLFWNKDWDLIDYILARFNVSKETAELFTKGMANFAPDYQSYMFSYAVTGDPNKFKQNNLPTWPLATDNGNEVIVLNTGNGFTSSWSVKPDTINTKNACDFWAKAAATIMAAVKAHRG